MPLLILIIGASALYVDFFPGAKFVSLNNIDGGFGTTMQTKLGLDLQGGVEIIYQARPTNGQPATDDQMSTIVQIIEARINGSGVAEPIVERVGSDEIDVQMPGVDNAEQVRLLVGQAGLLTFVPLDRTMYGYIDGTTGNAVAGTSALPAEGSSYAALRAKDPTLAQPLFGGDQVDGSKVAAAYDSSAVPPGWAVNLTLKSAGSTAFSTWSSANVGSYFMIVLDDKIQSVPYIKDAITTGTATISGSFTASTAQDLANVLKYGALPFPIAEVGIPASIPATLGKTFLDQTLLAGGIGIGLVLLFMLFYYRLPGAVASIALIYYTIAVLAVFRVVPVTLTLAGVAGFVLSVGMAVDANILIFERTKEELRTGKTLQSAVEAGFNRAWNSIFDSNMSSLITAGILYFFGTSVIKGFALVLIVGVATSMFTAVTVSRTLLRVVVRRGFANKAWLYGVTDEEFTARSLAAGRSRREGRARV